MFFSRIFTPDRRRQPRQFLNTSVRVFTGAGRIEGLGINVSEVGMCLFTAAHLAVGQEIQIEFVPLGKTEPIRLSATIRHRAMYLYGIEFPPDAIQTPEQIRTQQQPESPIR